MAPFSRLTIAPGIVNRNTQGIANTNTQGIANTNRTGIAKKRGAEKLRTTEKALITLDLRKSQEKVQSFQAIQL